MADKERALPPWMIRTKEEVKQPMKSRRKQKTARTAFYCMNEKELVEAAVSCLTDGDRQEALLQTHQQVAEKPKDTTQKKDEPITSKRRAKHLTKESDESTDCSDEMDATYISETDLDVTELDTVPYTDSQQHVGSEGQRSAPDWPRDQLTNPDEEKEKEKERASVRTPASAQEDDDSLRLVRDIFFKR